MAFKHGIYVAEIPTPITPPVRVETALSVAFVTAPVHLANDPYAAVHKPILCTNHAQAAAAFGYSTSPEIWGAYTACEMIFSHFTLYGVAPMVLINVLDPKIHSTRETGQLAHVANGIAIVDTHGVLLDTVQVQAGGMTLTSGTDYHATHNTDGLLCVNLPPDAAHSTLTVSFTRLAPEKVTIADYVGGYDAEQGRNFGLSLISEVFPRFRLVPSILLAPGASADPLLAAAMDAKATNISGHFDALALIDAPASLKYTDLPAWKNDNSITSPRMVVCYPKLRLGDMTFNFSSQLAGLIGRTDVNNGSRPHVSPSNETLRINGLCAQDGSEIVLDSTQAKLLNASGIMTAINFLQGWTAWGNHTAAYPANTDSKDVFIPMRRVFMWIANTIVLTHWRKLGGPITRRKIDSVVGSVNIWLNALTAREVILGGRIEFVPDDNPAADLMQGDLTFRVHISPPLPLQSATFSLRYDPQYLQSLFEEA